jgi:hypothetical protein
MNEDAYQEDYYGDEDDPSEGASILRMPGTGSKPQKGNVNKQERMRQAWELRKAGVSYDDIAQRLGYSSKAGAYNAVKSIMQQVTQETGKELQTLHHERLNTMLMMAWRNAQQGDMKAIDTVLRIMERQATMSGIDAPKQSTTNHVLFVGGDESDYIAALQQAAMEQAALEAGPLPDDIEDAVLVEEDDE